MGLLKLNDDYYYIFFQPSTACKSTSGMKNKKFMEAKVVMVGNVGVGKSSITVRYVLDKFDEKM